MTSGGERAGSAGEGGNATGVPVAAIAWILAAGLFIGLRLAASLTLPVFGAEIDHLSGAWLASIGISDHRYVPTLFQAITALVLRVEGSETLPRLAAVGASATVPAAFYLLRERLGDTGAVLGLTVLALNPVSIALDASAHAMALDEPVAAWLFVLLLRGGPNPIVGFAAGFFPLLCGPAPMLVLAARLVTARASWRSLPLAPLASACAGAALALVLASARFGLGFDQLVVPPFDLLAAGSEREWSTASAGELLLLYLPPVGAGIAVVVALAVGARGPRFPALLLAWIGLAGGWWLLSTWHENPVPAAAIGLPAAMAIGPIIVAGLRVVTAGERPLGFVGLAACGVFLILAGAIVADWARDERAGPAGEQALVALFFAAATLSLGAVVYARAATLLTPVLAVVGIAWLLAGATRMATGAGEPLTSPLSPQGARDLRDTALALRGTSGGEVVVHPDFAEAITWPFRDSGVLLVASRVPPTAAVVIWPAEAPAPEGFRALAGDWALTRTIRTPTADTLDFLHWLLDRNTLAARPDRIAVYTRAEP